MPMPRTLGFDGSWHDPTATATCDFCLTKGTVKWAYPVTDFAELPGEDNSGWATCDQCSALVEANDLNGLIRRVAKKVARRQRTTPNVIAPHLREVYERFMRTKGERVPSDGTLKDPTRQPAPDVEAEWDEMLALKSSRITFQVDGPELDADKTFSAETVREVEGKIGMFLGSRMMRQWQETQVPPHHMTVTLDVKVDGHSDSSPPTRIIIEDIRHSGNGRE